MKVGNKDQNRTVAKETREVTPKPAARPKKVQKTEAPAADSEAVSVKITSREPTPDEAKEIKKGYSPQEIRAKASAFLKEGNIPPEQKEALQRALTLQEMAEKSK